MKRSFFILAMVPLVLAASVPARADVDVRVGFGRGYRGHYGPRYRGGYWGRPYRTAVVVAPGYYASPDGYYPYYPGPVYAPAPVYAPEPPQTAQSPQDGTAVPISGDYATDLATLNGKLAKERTLLKRQKEKGGITQAHFEQFTNALEAIEHDEHERSYNNNGRLTDQDLAELIGRVDQTHEEIETALAE
jgi:hypothetical protein